MLCIKGLADLFGMKLMSRSALKQRCRVHGQEPQPLPPRHDRIARNPATVEGVISYAGMGELNLRLPVDVCLRVNLFVLQAILVQ